ncbi:DUF1764-domain-containing protein [Phellopilus nigrolimitatus]|nr:DUF1764-domain-containing protein [Phellopilus nigrolimitatus]
MPASEIDDIFSGRVSKVAVAGSTKGKGKAVPGSLSTSTPTPSTKSKKRKRREGEGGPGADAVIDRAKSSPLSKVLKKKKSPKDGTTVDGDVAKKVKRPRVVETVRDPSAGIGLSAAPSVPQKTPVSSSATKSKTKKGAGPDGEKVRFTDSRGTGPRRKTEEGFSVFKEDELGIGDEGGDTPLCPFDCDCCTSFFRSSSCPPITDSHFTGF